MLFLLGSLLLAAAPPATQPFDVAAHKTLLTAHAVGAQVYECKAAAGGALQWTFREPIASLIVDGKTVGRHYAGPHWALDDGSIVQGKVLETAPGATPGDIAQLKLSVVDRQGSGALAQATLVYRLRTHGGTLSGACTDAGALRAVAYSADYLFAR